MALLVTAAVNRCLFSTGSHIVRSINGLEQIPIHRKTPCLLPNDGGLWLQNAECMTMTAPAVATAVVACRQLIET
ncbi:hypothetical protein D918_00586 [Trichuris suis]|nr:hypothetical protein D918_00586 [Trichuris suis]